MHILMIAPQPFFTPRGTPLSVYYRLLTLAELGHTVDLMTWPAGRDVSLPGVRIIRSWRPPFIRAAGAGPSLAKLFLDMALFPRVLTRLARRPGGYDGLFVHEEAVAVALVAKRLFGLPFIYDMHSSLPEQFTAFGYADIPVVKRIFKRLEKAALARADCVLTICPDLDARVRRAGGAETVLLPNSRLDEIPEPDESGIEADRFAAAAAFAEKKAGESLLFYGGTLEAYQGIDLMLRAFTIVAAEKSGVKLLLLGGSRDQVQKIRDEYHDLCRSGRLFAAGSVSPGRTAALMGRADLLLSTRVRGTNTPLKLYACMAGGIPMVVTDIYSHTQELGPDQAFLAEPSAAALAGAMIQGLENRDLAARKAAAARALYEKKFSPDRYRQQLAKALACLKRQR